MFSVDVSPETLFLYSTSGSASSIEKHNNTLKELGLNLVFFTFPQDILSKKNISNEYATGSYMLITLTLLAYNMLWKKVYKELKLKPLW